MNLNPKFPLFLPGVKNSNNHNVSIIGANLREDITQSLIISPGMVELKLKLKKNILPKIILLFMIF